MANLDIKLQELNQLNKYADIELPSFGSYLEAQDYKLRLAREIKKKWVSFTPTVTNTSNKDLVLPNLNVHYKYQREGIYSSLGIDYYFGFKSKSHYEFTFTSSGQSANSSLLFALNRCFKLKITEASTIWYYESKLILEAFSEDKNKTSKKILFLDSSKSLDFSSLKDESEYDYAIIDTTCLAIGSEDLMELFQLVDFLKKPIFLTRSHLKLDTLGTDYGNLGSICVFRSNLIADSKEELIVKRYLDYDPFFNLLVETGAILGVGLSVDQFYPFLGDSQINRLNLARVNRIKSNYELYIEGIDVASDKCFIQETPHKLFFFVKYKYPVKMNAELFLKLNQVFQLNGKYCDSFGFDYMTHGNIIKYENGDEYTVVRITCPDYSLSDIEKSISLLNKYFKTLFSSP